MTRLFIIHDESDNSCVVQLQRDLVALGYVLLEDLPGGSPNTITHLRSWQRGILTSKTVIVAWNTTSSRSSKVVNQINYAVGLHKPVVLIQIDNEQILNTLAAINATIVQATYPCINIVDDVLPHLPQVGQDDPLLMLLGSTLSEERKRGISHASALLQQGNRRDEVTALLRNLINMETMPSVRSAAKEVLNNAQSQESKDLSPRESQHSFGLTCSKNHITYFDKREVCRHDGFVKRATQNRAGKRLDELQLRCTTCGEEIVVEIDCEGYR